MEGQPFGYLVWGVNNDTHEIIGTKFDFRVDVKNEPLEHYLARKVFPDNNFSFYEIKITNVYGKETYEFREKSIVVSIPFTRVSTEGIPPVIPLVIPPVDENIEYNKQEKNILDFCILPRGIIDIADMLGYKDKKTVRKYIKPLIEQGRLVMTIPDKPNSKNQKYVTVR